MHLGVNFLISSHTKLYEHYICARGLCSAGSIKDFAAINLEKPS